MSRPVLCLAGTHHIIDKQGGVESQVRNLGRIMADAGWKVVFLCPSLRGKSGPETIDGDHVEWFPQPSYGFQIPRREIDAILERVAPSVIYMRGRGMLQESGHPLAYCRRNGVPFVFGLSADSELETMYFSKVRSRVGLKGALKLPYFLWSDMQLSRMLKGATDLVAQHGEQRELVRGKLGRSAHLLRTLHPELGRPALKSERLKVLWIANYRPVKQGEMFVSLARDCADLPCDFVLVYGRTREEYIAPIRKMAAGMENLRLLPELRKEEAERLLEESLLFVNTSLDEGFPNTFVQAWLRGTPTVSLTVDPDSVLSREDIGVLSGAYDRLVADVRSLVQNPDRARAMGEKARNYAEGVHGLRAGAHKVVKFFSGVASRPPGMLGDHEPFDWTAV